MATTRRTKGAPGKTPAKWIMAKKAAASKKKAAPKKAAEKAPARGGARRSFELCGPIHWG